MKNFTIPDKFNYKSNINTLCPDIIYLAELINGKYVVTWNNGYCTTYYSVNKMKKFLSKKEFEIIINNRQEELKQ